jgi:hypothetical protein
MIAWRCKCGKFILYGARHLNCPGDELDRLKRTIQQYTQWLTPEFPDVVTVLENLQAVGEGKESLCASNPPNPTGPWSVGSLREVLRARRLIRQNAADQRRAHMETGLKIIRYAGQTFDPTAVWMQKIAAHALDPEKWPLPPDQPPASRK